MKLIQLSTIYKNSRKFKDNTRILEKEASNYLFFVRMAQS